MSQFDETYFNTVNAEEGSDYCSSIESEHEHICVFHANSHDRPGMVCIHTDTAPMYLTPEDALKFAASIGKFANEAAEVEVE